MFEFVIGSNLTTNEALNTLKAKCGEFNFPQTLQVKNLMPRDVVEASVNLFLDSAIKENGVSERQVEFPTFGHLMKFVTDMETVAKMNHFSRAIIVKGEQQEQSTQENKVETESKTSKTKKTKKELSHGN